MPGLTFLIHRMGQTLSLEFLQECQTCSSVCGIRTPNLILIMKAKRHSIISILMLCFLSFTLPSFGAWRICPMGDSITSGYTDPGTWIVPFNAGYRSGLYKRLTNNMSFEFVGTSGEPWNGQDGPVANNPSIDLRSIGYDQHAEIVKGIVNLHLTVKTCLPKSACWAKDDSRSDYTLNHEQRHFDIAKMVSEHFKQKLAAGKLNVDNYEGIVNMEYLDTYREMNIIQKQYDDETRHGTDTAEQGRWNLRIDKELKALGIK